METCRAKNSLLKIPFALQLTGVVDGALQSCQPSKSKPWNTQPQPFIGQVTIDSPAIFRVPDHINQIICLFQMLTVHLQLILCFKDLLVIEITFKKPQKYELSSWQPERERIHFYINLLLESLLPIVLKCLVFVVFMIFFSKKCFQGGKNKSIIAFLDLHQIQLHVK